MIDQIESNPNSEALSFMLEMELVSSPTVLNAMILNVFKAVRGLKDAEFVIDTNRKRLLVFLELKYLSRLFYKDQIEDKVLNMLDQTLPSFKKRVVFDRSILNKALALVKNEK